MAIEGRPTLLEVELRGADVRTLSEASGEPLIHRDHRIDYGGVDVLGRAAGQAFLDNRNTFREVDHSLVPRYG